MGGAIECPLCGNNQAYCKCTRLEVEQFLELRSLRAERRGEFVWCIVSGGSGMDGDEFDLHAIHGNEDAANREAEVRNGGAPGRDWYRVVKWHVENTQRG